MLTKERMRDLVAELSQANVAALLRADAGLQFDGRVAIGRLRELELLEKASWGCTEDGRQVVGFLVGIPYKPKWVREMEEKPEMVAGVPADERERTPASKLRARHGTNGKFKPREGVEVHHTKSMRPSICAQCLEEVPEGTSVIWIQDKGLLHPDCVETS